MRPTSRWRFHPWGRNAKAICERLEDLIVEIRMAEVRASDIAVTSMQNKTAFVAAIKEALPAKGTGG